MSGVQPQPPHVCTEYNAETTASALGGCFFFSFVGSFSIEIYKEYKGRHGCHYKTLKRVCDVTFFSRRFRSLDMSNEQNLSAYFVANDKQKRSVHDKRRWRRSGQGS